MIKFCVASEEHARLGSSGGSVVELFAGGNLQMLRCMGRGQRAQGEGDGGGRAGGRLVGLSCVCRVVCVCVLSYVMWILYGGHPIDLEG